jgi:hypothetical protein
MDKRDLYKEEDEEASENEEEEEVDEQEESEEEVVEEEEEGVFDFDDNFNQTGKFTVNEASTVLRNDPDKNYENTAIDTNKPSSNVQNVRLNRNESDDIDFNIPESNEKNFERNIKDKLDILDLDLESMPKEDLINLLLRSDEPQSQKKKKKNFQLKPKNAKPHILNSVYSNMQNMAENKDPELAEDFNVALTKILAKMMKESNNQNAEIFDILISDRDKVEEELRKVNRINKYILS